MKTVRPSPSHVYAYCTAASSKVSSVLNYGTVQADDGYVGCLYTKDAGHAFCCTCLTTMTSLSAAGLMRIITGDHRSIVARKRLVLRQDRTSGRL
ncbi:hypothetical protein CIB48_g11319, partial [Xylaria polymorpha]